MTTFTIGAFEIKVLYHLSMRGCSEKKMLIFLVLFHIRILFLVQMESFFMSDWKEHSGAWCVDPPFLTKTLERVDHIVGRWRKEGSPPILYIGPSRYKMQTLFDEYVCIRMCIIMKAWMVYSSTR